MEKLLLKLSEHFKIEGVGFESSAHLLCGTKTFTFSLKDGSKMYISQPKSLKVKRLVKCIIRNETFIFSEDGINEIIKKVKK